MIRMRSSDKNYGTLSWYLPGSSRMYLSEEKVNKDRHGPKYEVVDPWYHAGVTLRLASHSERVESLEPALYPLEKWRNADLAVFPNNAHV